MQVYPREYRRALDEAAKLKAAQAAEAELLKEVGAAASSKQPWLPARC